MPSLKTKTVHNLLKLYTLWITASNKISTSWISQNVISTNNLYRLVTSQQIHCNCDLTTFVEFLRALPIIPMFKVHVMSKVSSNIKSFFTSTTKSIAKATLPIIFFCCQSGRPFYHCIVEDRRII